MSAEHILLAHLGTHGVASRVVRHICPCSQQQSTVRVGNSHSPSQPLLHSHSTVKALPFDTQGGTPPFAEHRTALSRTVPEQQWLRPPGRFWQPDPPHCPHVAAQQMLPLEMPRAQWVVVVV